MNGGPPELPGLVFERMLGSGGFSDVYLYRQQLPLRHVAVKVLKDSGLADSLRSQLTSEANAMAGLADHPNIVQVFSAAVSNDGRPYIVMSYYSRPNLAVRAATERFAVAEVLRIGICVASAVETAHRAGILHRDIKPANILTNQYGAPGLTDFGIAGRIHGEEEDEIGVSLPWTAPEVLYATEPASVRSDVYSLGATLWHLLVGRSPFQVRGGDNSDFELMRRIRDVPPPSTGRADVPDSLERLLRQCMAKDPNARVPSAMELARGLQAIEQELHLPRTDIVVLSDRTEVRARGAVPPASQTAAGADAPATVARPASYAAQPGSPPQRRRPATASSPAPSAVGPSPSPDAVDSPVRPSPAAPSTAPGAAAAGPTTRSARNSRQPAAATTHARPDSYRGQPPPGPPEAPRHAEEPTPRRPPGPLLAAAAAIVAAGAVVGGFVLFSGGTGNDHAARSTVPEAPGTQNAGNLGENVPPGPVKVTGKRTANGGVVFTWTYDAPMAGDTFVWRETAGGALHDVAHTRTVRVPAPHPPATVCLQVRVVRADGSNASATFSRPGCVR